MAKASISKAWDETRAILVRDARCSQARHRACVGRQARQVAEEDVAGVVLDEQDVDLVGGVGHGAEM